MEYWRDWNPFAKRKVIEGPQQITEESLWQVVWANCSHQFYNPGWINTSKSITFSTQNNLLDWTNARTTDSLFIFKQLLHKFTKQHEKLYVGFIDYEKAFDSVWQSGMIYKLQKEGVKGKFQKVIKSMYSSIRSCLKVNQNTVTESFLCNKGIRQGDGLSPVLFSLFMNDLREYFRAHNWPGVKLGN